MSSVAAHQYCLAIINGRADEVRVFLKQGTFSADTIFLEKEVFFRDFDKDGRPADKMRQVPISSLELSAENGRVLVLTELLRQSPDTKFRDQTLFRALKKGHKQAVEILMQYGANPWVKYAGFSIYWVVLDERYELRFSEKMKNLFREYGSEPPESNFSLPYTGASIH